MTRASKLVMTCAGDRRMDRAIMRCIRAGGNQAIVSAAAADAVSLLRTNPVDLIILGCRDKAQAAAVLDAAYGQTNVALLAAPYDLSTALALADHYALTHVISCDVDRRGALQVDPAEIAITTEKLLHGGIFGLNKYIPRYGVQFHKRRLIDPAARSIVVTEVRDYARQLGCGSGLENQIVNVADELIAQGLERFSLSPNRSLGDGYRSGQPAGLYDSWIHVEYGCDGRWFGISVSDWVGSFAHTMAVAGLCRRAMGDSRDCPDAVEIGLFTLLNSCSQLVFNVAPGLRTEAIAMVDIDHRSSTLRDRGRSLHLFTETNQAAGDAWPAANIVAPAAIVQSKQDRGSTRRRDGVVWSSSAKTVLHQLADGSAPIAKSQAVAAGETRRRRRRRTQTFPNPQLAAALQRK